MGFNDLGRQDLPHKTEAPKEGQTIVIQEKVWLMERLVAMYADQEKGFSAPMLGIKMAISNPESLKSPEGLEIIRNLEQGISNFLIEFGKLTPKDQANFGLIPKMQIGNILKSVKDKDWENYSKAAQVLNAYFCGMESILQVISVSPTLAKE